MTDNNGVEQTPRVVDLKLVDISTDTGLAGNCSLYELNGDEEIYLIDCIMVYPDLTPMCPKDGTTVLKGITLRGFPNE